MDLHWEGPVRIGRSSLVHCTTSFHCNWGELILAMEKHLSYVITGENS